MILLSDTDIIIKLCACDLMNDALRTFRVKFDDVRILDEAKIIIKYRDKELSLQYGKEAFRRIRQFVDNSKTISSGSKPEQEELLNIPGIDQGEAVLFSSISQYNDFSLITGDKKCLRSLGKCKGLDDLKNRLSGRCYCLEKVIIEIIKHLGIEALRPKFDLFCRVDKSLQSVFSRGKTLPKKRLLEKLQVKIDDLKQDAGDLLA